VPIASLLLPSVRLSARSALPICLCHAAVCAYGSQTNSGKARFSSGEMWECIFLSEMCRLKEQPG